MKEKIYDIIKLLVCFLFFFFLGSLISLIFKAFGTSLKLDSYTIMPIYQFIISSIMVALLYLLYHKSIIKDFKKFQQNTEKNITYIIKMFIIFMLIKFAVSFISGLIMLLLGINAESLTSFNQQMIEICVKKSPILMFTSTVMFAPFYEETMFRLGFKKIINNRIIFIIISGLLFGCLHIFPLDEGVTLQIGLIQSISYITMGMFLAYIYSKKKNIFFSIGVHLLNNLLSILIVMSGAI